MDKKNKGPYLKLYEEGLIEDLKDPEEAVGYLEAAFEMYEEDGCTEALLLALGHLTKAQGGVAGLAKRVNINREHLYDILANRHKPCLDNWLKILSGLGFRIRFERQKAAA